MDTTASILRENLAEYLSKVEHKNERVVIKRNGKEIGAIIPTEDLELLETIEDIVDAQLAHEGIKDAATNGTVRWEDIEKEEGP